MTIRNLIQTLLSEAQDLDMEVMISRTEVDAFGDRETEYFDIDTIYSLGSNEDIHIQLCRK